MSVDGDPQSIRDTLPLNGDGGTHRVDVRIPVKAQTLQPADMPARIGAGDKADQAKKVLSIS
jgi:hypothetical protein